MDVNLPGMDGIKATKKIVMLLPNVCIIGLSVFDGKKIVMAMEKSGAKAFLTKAEALDSLCGTIRDKIKK